MLFLNKSIINHSDLLIQKTCECKPLLKEIVRVSVYLCVYVSVYECTCMCVYQIKHVKVRPEGFIFLKFICKLFKILSFQSLYVAIDKHVLLLTPWTFLKENRMQSFLPLNSPLPRLLICIKLIITNQYNILPSKLILRISHVCFVYVLRIRI